MNMKQLIKKYTIKIYKKLTHIIPTSKKIIIFQSSNGRNYTGNPRYIYEEMIRQGLDKKYKCIWFYLIQVLRCQEIARRSEITISHISGI
ncbi:MAG: CDP-glycerol glycerophosphotransferase family protein [Anaerostipes sp.]